MKRTCVALCCLLMASAGGSARAETADVSSSVKKLDDKIATVAAWRFARCAVNGHGKEVREILKVKLETDNVDGDKRARYQALQKFAKQGYCIAPGDSLKAGPQLFFDLLGGAVFLNKYDDAPLPNYADSAPVFTVSDIDKAKPGVLRTEMVLRVFAECVFRLNPNGVKTLIMSRPFSPEEDASIRGLQAQMGICLPAQEGEQVKFSKLMIREFLSMAAYLVDEFREISKKKQSYMMTRERGPVDA